MNRKLLLTLCAVTFATISACSSNDDDDSSSQEPTAGENQLPGGGPVDTSELAPGGDVDVPPSSTPGGDTSAIAGLWDATFGEAGAVDERYVLISEDGLYTDYDYRQDGIASDGNCYIATGPYTLTLEDSTTNTYGISDDRIFSATRNDEATELSIAFEDEEPQTWPIVSGMVADDLELCP